jgi:hypothetical protein
MFRRLVYGSPPNSALSGRPLPRNALSAAGTATGLGHRAVDSLELRCVELVAARRSASSPLGRYGRQKRCLPRSRSTSAFLFLARTLLRWFTWIRHVTVTSHSQIKSFSFETADSRSCPNLSTSVLIWWNGGRTVQLDRVKILLILRFRDCFNLDCFEVAKKEPGASSGVRAR